MTSLPDLMVDDGITSGPGWSFKYKVVQATSERGQIFLHAYQKAVAQESGDPHDSLGTFYGEPGDDDFEFEHLSILPEKFDLFKRQASLARLSVGESKDYPEYDSAV